MAQSCSSADVTGNTELANRRRRARSRCHFRPKQAEELAQSYRDKLAV
jgi:predicted N-formylglutamate amidohydrolase